MALNTGTIGGYNFANIVAAAPTTTVVKTGEGILHTITFNKPVAESVVTIYDNTAGSGDKIGTITLPTTLLSDAFTLRYDATVTKGITIVTSTGASDITVTYV